MIEQVMSSEEDDVIGSDYGHESDFEDELDESDGDSTGSIGSHNDNKDNIQIIVQQFRDRGRGGRRGYGYTKGKTCGGRERGRTNNPRAIIAPGWTTNTADFNDLQFTPYEQPGPKNLPNYITAQSSPIDYFSLFWTEELWDLFVTETVREGQRIIAARPTNYCAKWLTQKPLSKEELKAFFGLRISMEMLLYKDRFEQYWRLKDNFITVTPGFGEIMPRDRFLAIWSLLHCVNEADPQLDKTDKIYKTRPVFNYLIPKFRQYFVPGCELSLDEGMIPTKNRLSFKQYIKDKPIKWGVKTFLLCDSDTGYICNAEVYTGKKDSDSALSNLGVTGNLVISMIKDYKDQNYILYTDRFYTSVQLVQYLIEHEGVRMIGTAMPYRREFPKSLVKGKNEMQKGEFELLYNGTVAAIVWQDKHPIYFITSVYINSPVETVQRYDAREKRRVPIHCPKAVKAYNTFMGGTDKDNQMTKLQKSRRQYKWPRRLVMKFMMWAAYNAYVLMGFKKSHVPASGRTYTFHFFLEDLSKELVGDVRSSGSVYGRRSSVEGQGHLRLKSDIQHLVERGADAKGNNRCAVCRERYLRAKQRNPQAKDCNLPKRCKTVYRCAVCEEYLCIGKPDDNCWEKWHTKKEYWK